MKKLLFTFCFLFLTCADNGDSDSSIAGRWNLTSLSENGIVDNLSSCDLKSYMILSENNSGIYYQYYTDYDNLEIEPCGLDLTSNIILEYVKENTYLVTFTSNYDGFTQTGSAEINNDVFTYSYDNIEAIFIKE